MAMQIKLEHVTANYRIGPLLKPRVLDDVSLTLTPGRITAVVGPTGAGKSSLLKVCNGLLIPSEGHVTIGSTEINSKTSKQSLKTIRKHIGMVFQFPESQLFAETVGEDIAFGPLNFGTDQRRAEQLARKALQQVGLDESILSKSPFSLSGGQKRRVAIAGVLASEPEVILLDEPTAGLDPAGRKELLTLLKRWHDEEGKTILFVTHDMESTARFAEDVIVMENGSVVYHDAVRPLFENTRQLKEWQLDLPEARRFQLGFEAQSGIHLPHVCLTEKELMDALIEVGCV